jgi:hypothetical protein
LSTPLITGRPSARPPRSLAMCFTTRVRGRSLDTMARCT